MRRRKTERVWLMEAEGRAVLRRKKCSTQECQVGTGKCPLNLATRISLMTLKMRRMLITTIHLTLIEHLLCAIHCSNLFTYSY